MDNPNAFPKHKIKVLLLEKINQSAVQAFKDNGYSVTEVPKSLPEEELLEQIKDVHVLGIRSKTKVSAAHIEAGKNLLAIGCFGVGTNQVDKEAANNAGIPVFNAPFASTRSVAELAVAGILNLSRKLGDCNNNIHKGEWKKSAVGAFEVRDKVLGILGYGHIGQQVGLMAEAIGLRVVFYDMMKRLPLGNSHQVESMKALFEQSDFISLHLPALPGGKALVGAEELKQIKKGSYLLNLSRGSLVDIPALKAAIEAGDIGGAMLDVYPAEPRTNSEPFEFELAGVENCFLTPHIGGSTQEAQKNIGLEVASTLTKYIDNGQSHGSVNFPQVLLPAYPDSSRILSVHQNVPGVMSEINNLCSELGVNIDSQYLSTHKEVGYLIMDVSPEKSAGLADKVRDLPMSIKTRVLY